jgi:hypothetical protein
MKSKLLHALALALSLTTTACRSGGTAIGKPMEERPAVHFAVVDAAPEKFLDQTVLVEATVKAVCQNSGCWMQIEDQGRSALVRWETGCGGEYAFPKDAAGKRVLIQGTFYRKSLSPEEAEHLKKESGGKVELALETYEFNASAVRILD